MHLPKVLLYGILAFLACAMPGIQARPFGDGPTWIRSCDDIPAEATLAGTTLTILSSIDCGTNPKTIVVTGDTVVRSHAPMNTMGIALKVQPGANLTIRAPTVMMKRREASAHQYKQMDNQPILRVFGSIHFDVTRWLPEHLDGTLIDKHGVVAFEFQGSLESPNVIRYTSTSVVVADPAAADQKESIPAETSMPADPELRRKLADFHAAATAQDLPPINTSPTATVREVADGKSSSSATAPNRAAAFSIAAARNDGNNGDKTAAASKATPASSTPATATAVLATPSTGTAANPSTRADVGNNAASGASMAEFMTDKARQARAVEDHGKTAGAGGGGEGSSPIHVSNTWTTKKKARQHRQQQQEDRRPSNPNGTGGNNSNGSIGDKSNNNNNNNNNNHHHYSNTNTNGNSFSPLNQFHEENVLRSGRLLFGKLLSPGKKAMIYVSPNSGSVVHASCAGKAPLDEQGRKIGPVPQKLLTVITPNEQQMFEIERNRSEIWEHRLGRSKASREGRERKRSKMVAITGVLPFGKNGFLRRRRAREHAEAHLMEATLKLTNRGNLEVSIDGTIVQRKSRPSWFGFLRSKDPSYELRVTMEGIEIYRRGKLDWVIKAEDIF
ncbi:unnamed protein product [Ectocarpus sp. 4 AP-2014]